MMMDMMIMSSLSPTVLLAEQEYNPESSLFTPYQKQWWSNHKHGRWLYEDDEENSDGDGDDAFDVDGDGGDDDDGDLYSKRIPWEHKTPVQILSNLLPLQNCPLYFINCEQF